MLCYTGHNSKLEEGRQMNRMSVGMYKKVERE